MSIRAERGCLADESSQVAVPGIPLLDSRPYLAGGQPMTSLTLASPAFEDGDPIPDRYGYSNENVNPPLSIDGVPETAESLALVVDDPDAIEPAGTVWDHWVLWNIDPEQTEIPEDWSPTSTVQGANDYGSVGYGGPNPPNKTHTYRFRLVALDTTLGLDSGATKADLESAITGHVLAETTLEGTFSP